MISPVGGASTIRRTSIAVFDIDESTQNTIILETDEKILNFRTVRAQERPLKILTEKKCANSRE